MAEISHLDQLLKIRSASADVARRAGERRAMLWTLVREADQHFEASRAQWEDDSARVISELLRLNTKPEPEPAPEGEQS